jgi:flagellar biosynthetic protein FliR
MHVEFTFQYATLFGFLLVLARVSGVLVFVPIPGFSAGPQVARIVLALAVTVALFPTWRSHALPGGFDNLTNGWLLGRLVGWMALEAFVGLAVGITIAFLLEALQMGAQIIGLQAGYSYASTVDPSTQADTTTLQLIAQLLAGMLFFAFGLDRQVLRMVANSLQSASLPAQASAEAIIRLGANVFSTGLQLAIPVLALLVLLDVAFAVLGRLHAQMQLLSLSFSIKMLAGIAFLASILSVYPDIFARSAGRTFEMLSGMFPSPAP